MDRAPLRHKLDGRWATWVQSWWEAGEGRGGWYGWGRCGRCAADVGDTADGEYESGDDASWSWARDEFADGSGKRYFIFVNLAFFCLSLSLSLFIPPVSEYPPSPLFDEKRNEMKRSEMGDMDLYGRRVLREEGGRLTDE